MNGPVFSSTCRYKSSSWRGISPAASLRTVLYCSSKKPAVRLARYQCVCVCVCMNSHGQGVVAKRKNCFRPSSKCKKSRSGRAPSGFSWQGVKRAIHLSVFFPRTQTDTGLFYRTRPPLVICKFAHEPFPPSLVILPAATVICNSQHFTSNKGPAQRNKREKTVGKQTGRQTK